MAPRTTALTVMLAVGAIFPRGDRAPAIAPISKEVLEDYVRGERDLDGWNFMRQRRVDSGFYISQALELARP